MTYEYDSREADHGAFWRRFDALRLMKSLCLVSVGAVAVVILLVFWALM